LFGVDYHTRAFEEYPNLAPGGLVCDCRYFGLDNLAAVEFDPDAGAYAVVHSDGYYTQATTTNAPETIQLRTLRHSRPDATVDPSGGRTQFPEGHEGSGVLVCP
jgi:hypothetical protein